MDGALIIGLISILLTILGSFWRLSSQIATLRSEIGGLRSELGDLRARLDRTDIEGQRDRVTRLEAAVESVRERLAKVEAR